MGTTNHGTQAIMFQYYLEATAENFGKLCIDVIPTGIYSGGRAEILGDSSLQIKPFVIAIQDSTNQVTVRSTVSAVLTTGVLDSGGVSSSTPYLILRWIHTSSAANYVEIHAIASLSARQQYDLVIGKMTFTGAVLTGFDYTDRTHPRSSDVAFRVEPTATPSMSLIVHGGRFPLGSSNYPVPDTQIGPFTLPAAPFSRIDLVYVSAAGAVTILQGTPAVTPVVPDYGGRLVLAEVRVVNNDVSLTWNRITDVRPSIWPVITPDGTTIQRNPTTGLLEVVSSVGSMFGSWTDLDSSGNLLVVGGVYKATLDGFVCALSAGVGGMVSGYTDGSNPPITLRAQNQDGSTSNPMSITMPVRKNDFWKITGTVTKIYWLPFGGGQSVKQ